jgi:Tir chaperone protein (CesT) family
LPPFYVQLGANWVMLSILPIIGPGEWQPDDLYLRLLAENRSMRLAKFALDDGGAVVLCAELPTESLDESELADAVRQMIRYARAFRTELGAHKPLD